MTISANPLIKDNKSDTIDRILYKLEFLMLSSNGDIECHPGLVLALEGIQGAVNSLRESPK